MGLTVAFVSGPSRTGKSTVIRAMLNGLCRRPPHYLRLKATNGSSKAPATIAVRTDGLQVASARWLNYHQDLIFEVLPEALAEIHRRDRYGVVLIEADADPQLRNAYPYDHRVFVMSAPRTMTEVFRSVSQAAQALRGVLDDTTAFVTEIYGLLDEDGVEDEHEPRQPFTTRGLSGFLNSPLGEELATRIQFQPAYHGLAESDLVLINQGLADTSPTTLDCVTRIERLLERLRGPTAAKDVVFCCNLSDSRDPNRQRVLRRLGQLVRT